MPHTIAADDPVDLQMHTTRSDGVWTPEALFDHLAARGFKVVGVTDHDQVDVDGTLQAIGATRGVGVIPAVEVTTRWGERPVDLLCFGFDARRGSLATLTRGILTEQVEIARAVSAELERQGYAFPRRAEVLASTGGEIIHPSAIVRLLMEHGYTQDFRAAVDMLVAAGHRSAAAPLAEAIAAAHADGGVAIITHPGREEVGFTTFDRSLLDALRAAGLAIDGLEVFYPLHTPDQVRDFSAYVAAQGWLASSGSDSHGPNQRLPIPYPAHQIAALLERCGYSITHSS